MRFLPQSQGKELLSYSNIRDVFIHHIKNRYVQRVQHVTNILKDMIAFGLNAEDQQERFPEINMIR